MVLFLQNQGNNGIQTIANIGFYSTFCESVRLALDLPFFFFVGPKYGRRKAPDVPEVLSVDTLFN